MSGWLILALVCGPALLAPLLLLIPARRAAAAAIPAAGAVAVLVAVLGAPGQQAPDLQPLILSLTIGLDAVAVPLLAQLGLVWVLVGWVVVAERPYGGRPFPLVCLLLTMGGSLGCAVALDTVSFYVFLSLMTVASFGLVDTGRGDPEERRAGRVYLTLALAGEFLTLAAFMVLTAGSSGEAPVWLLVFGIGAKLGVLPLHVALPLVYGAAPRPGGAVMGGALVTAAAIGWLRFLPLTADALPGAVPAVLVLGLAGAFLGVLLGLAQRDARQALGYSTVSQMGLFTTFTAVAAADPSHWAAIVPALAAFLVHHGLSKAGLLLAVRRGAATPDGMALGVAVTLSLALAAAPGTGGAIAKLWIEEELTRLPGLWQDVVKTVLPFTSAATALLMARIVWLAARAGKAEPSAGRAAAVPAVVCLVLALAVPWLVVLAHHDAAMMLVLSAKHLWKTSWPVVLGLGLFLAAWALSGRGRTWPAVPPGDMLAALAVAWRRLAPPARGAAAWAMMNAAMTRVAGRLARDVRRTLAVTRGLDRRWRDMRVMGGAFVTLVVLFTVVLLGT